MKSLVKVLTVLLVALSMLASSVTVIFTDAAPSSYSDSRNSGKRGEVCTTLSGTGASSYYTGSYTPDRLFSLSSSTLLSTLRTLMKSTHSYQSSYSNCRDYADETDCENGNSSIIMIYTSYASSQSEYSGGSGWNREHVWPKSLGGFETSGAGADLHHIRPSENKTNSNRGNLKYGELSGGKQAIGNLSGDLGGYYGSYFEPLDNVKGDVARICLYVYVRWGGEYSKCSSITNVFQSVDVLLEWCALDPVDTWEMGRNEVVEDIQGNRNVFIDYPELAWQLFGRTAPANMTTPSGGAGSNPGGSGSGGSTSCPHSSTYKVGVVTATCKAGGYTGDTYCSSCGVLVAKGTSTPKSSTHASTSVTGAKAPTCGVEGFTGNATCTLCGTVVTSGTAIPPTGNHIFGDWTLVSGTRYKRVCSVCDSVEYKNESCSHTETETKGAKSPTCSADGYTGDVYCTVCEARVSSGSVIPKTGNHSFGEWVQVTGTQYKHTCAICLAIEYKNEECPHSSFELVGATDATCGAEGYTGDLTCSVCYQIIERGTYTPRTGTHSFGEWSTVSGTLKKHTCSVCGRIEHMREDCDHATTEIRGAREASCSSQGYTGDVYCTDCGFQTAHGEPTPTAEHVFIVNEVLKEATESSVGIARQDCIVCGHSEVTATPPLAKSGPDTTTVIIASAGGGIALIAVLILLKKLLFR